MSAADTRTTVNPASPERLRRIFDDADALGMVYAETYRARRDNLPHDVDAACGLTRQVPGCDGLCSVAIAEVIEDLVGFYRRQLQRGVADDLANPGGYARSIIRKRHLDVIRALATPEDGYRRPERIADASKRPAYLRLVDDIDGLLVAASMFYLRSGATPTDWARVCEHAEATCRRKGHHLSPGEGQSRLDRFVAGALEAGGRAEAFVRRELLDLLAARSVTSVANFRGRSTPTGTEPDEHIDAGLDRAYVTALLKAVDAELTSAGGWSQATPAERREAVARALGNQPSDADLGTVISLISEIHAA